MAKYFSQKSIDEFKECFYFLQTRGVIESPDALEKTMQSLNFNPTSRETLDYFKRHNKDGRIDFAQLLDVLHEHSKVEKVHEEILSAFVAQDRDKKGVLPASEISQILVSTGERMTHREVHQLFREAGMPNQGLVDYRQLLQSLLAPLPDYS